MFTALILMCLSETSKFPDQCVVMTSNYFFETQEDCEYSVYQSIMSGELIAINPDKKPVDFYCVNWSALKA